MNYGFIKPVIIKEHRIFGSSVTSYKIHKEDGNWENDLAPKEIQNEFLETYNCTSYNTLSQIETYMKGVFGISVDYSDRWLGIIAGTRPPGNDPSRIYDAIRKYGLVPDHMLPSTPDITTIEEYYSFKGGDKDACYAEGQKWLEKWNFEHDWVFQGNYSIEKKINKMKLALKMSPLALAVYAWAQDQKGNYIRINDDNHWTNCYNIDQLLKIMDSYEPPKKDVDMEIYFCKMISISKIESSKKKENWLTRLLDLIKKLWQ